jgi:hypothetical protein
VTARIATIRPRPVTRVRVDVYLPPALLAEIDAARGRTSRSMWIARMSEMRLYALQFVTRPVKR